MDMCLYEPAKEGLQWQSGAVGNAAWTGVRLCNGSEAGGGVSGQRWFSSARTEESWTAARNRFTWSDRVHRLWEGHLGARSLLAYAMNDEPLPLFTRLSLRAVVAGWYGMAWIKGGEEMHIIVRPLPGLLASPRLLPWGARARQACGSLRF